MAGGHLADDGQVEVLGMRGQERIAEQPGAHAREGGAEQAEADPAERADPQPGLDPAGAARHVLKDEARSTS